MDFIIYVVIAAVAFIIGWNLRGVVFLATLSQNPRHFMTILKQIEDINKAEEAEATPLEGVEVQAENVNGYWYAYAKQSNQFLGQGSTLEDALKSAADRFPGKKFWCNKSEDVHQRA